MFRILSSILLVALLAAGPACAESAGGPTPTPSPHQDIASPTPTVEPTPAPGTTVHRPHPELYAENIDLAAGYLLAHYNPDLHLVCESNQPGLWNLTGPDGIERFWTMDNIYWLGDNRLASMGLKPHHPDIADRIARKVAGYHRYELDHKCDLLAGERIGNIRTFLGNVRLVCFARPDLTVAER